MSIRVHCFSQWAAWDKISRICNLMKLPIYLCRTLHWNQLGYWQKTTARKCQFPGKAYVSQEFDCDTDDFWPQNQLWAVSMQNKSGHFANIAGQQGSLQIVTVSIREQPNRIDRCHIMCSHMRGSGSSNGSVGVPYFAWFQFLISNMVFCFHLNWDKITHKT